MNTYYTPINAVHPEVAKSRRAIFEEALTEIDPETRERVELMIGLVAEWLRRERGLGEAASIGQATEFIAECVWHKASGIIEFPY